ncbi:MAG: hypothetical protein JRI55_01845 [Deltaproteobacteria bacterium]|jgi:hypothetical protein|nr:hypothetical protein [Deltaproteobacteria bacterium]
MRQELGVVGAAVIAVALAAWPGCSGDDTPAAPTTSAVGGAAQGGAAGQGGSGAGGAGQPGGSGGGGSEECSSHAIAVEVPPYDSGNAEHFLIQTVEDWDHIDDPDKRVFYVAAHDDYGTVTITASGTATEPRYLALYDDTGQHPAQLPTEQQANVRLIFDGVSHWVVHRLSGIGYSDQYALRIEPVSHHIVVDRMNFDDFRGAVLVLSGPDPASPTHDITIQHNRMDSMSMTGIDGDAVAVMLSGDPWDEFRRVENVHILDNEIRNCNDGVMLIRHPELAGGHEVDYPGTIIDCNHIYVDSEVYTDGAGNQDPDGLWAFTENAIDLKGGSEDPAKPVVVSNNFMWGYRHTDTNGGGSGSWGTAFGGHYDVKNLEVFGNVIFDSNRGLTFGDPHGLPYSVENLYAHDNIFYDIGFSTSGDTEYCHYFYESRNVRYEHNTVVGVEAHSRWFSHGDSETGLEVRCNAIVDSAAMTGTRAADTIVEDNYLYDTDRQQDGDGQLYGSAAEAGLEDLVFTTDRYTNQPRTITLPNVVTTAASPHADWCTR